MAESKMLLTVFIATMGSTLFITADDYPMCTYETDGWTVAGKLGAHGDAVTGCKDTCRNNPGTTFCAVSRRGPLGNYVDCYCGEDPPEASETGCYYQCQSACGGDGGLRSVYPVCPLGEYGSDCGTSCGHCLDDYCQVTSGECPSGCVDGYYLDDCMVECSSNCVQTTCDRDTGSCDGGCDNGWYTPQCTTACPVNCDTSCHIDSGDCDQGCKPGWYSTKCTDDCPTHCTDTLCHQTTGGCFSCNPGWYTGNCDVPCSDNCAQTSCSMDNGACEGGCKDGWYLADCTAKCSSNCAQTTCDIPSGSCDAGCKDGWFERKCTSPCPTNCDPYTCDLNGGNCDGGCTDEYFGPHCGQPCHTNCHMKCDKKSGECTNGCDDGYYGVLCDQICPKCGDSRCNNDSGHCYSCPPGFYDVTCTTPCPNNCEGDTCDMGGGACIHGCKTGWNGSMCDDDVDECARTELNNCHLIGTRFQCYNFEGYFLCCDNDVTTNGNQIVCAKCADLPVWIWPTMIAALLLGAGVAVTVLKIFKCGFNAPLESQQEMTITSQVVTNKPVVYQNIAIGMTTNEAVTARATEQITDNYSEIQAIDCADIEYGPSYETLGLEEHLPPNVYDTLNK